MNDLEKPAELIGIPLDEKIRISVKRGVWLLEEPVFNFSHVENPKWLVTP